MRDINGKDLYIGDNVVCVARDFKNPFLAKVIQFSKHYTIVQGVENFKMLGCVISEQDLIRCNKGDFKDE